MNFQHIRHDLFAAIAGALTTLPQAVAYGLIAVSPLGPDWAVFGISIGIGSTILFGIVTGLFGSQPLMLAGPSSSTALVFASSIAVALGRGHGATEALTFAVLGLVVAGFLQFCAGLLRLGHAIAYVPTPVLAGFANASAVLVILTALPSVLGAPHSTITALLAEVLSGQFGDLSLWAMIVGGVTIIATFALEGRIRFVPAALLAMAVGTALYHALSATLSIPEAPQIGLIDLAVLLQVPALFQSPVSWPRIWADADIVLLSGLSIGLLSSFSAVVSGGALAARIHSRQDANHDLIIQGLANMLMGGLGFVPGASGLIRSAAVIDAGGKTRVANVGAALVLGVLLAVLAPLVAVIPLWSSAGMLLATSVQVIDRKMLNTARDLLLRRLPYPRIIAGDIVITLVVVAAAIMFGLIAAVGFGVLLSIVLFVLGMGRNPVRRTYFGSRVHSKVQRSAAQVERLEREGHRIAVIELQGALFFGSCAALQAVARDYLENGVEYLILDFSHLTAIDSTGAATLRTIHSMYAQNSGTVCISYVERERRSRSLQPNETDTAPPNNGRLRNTFEPRWIWLSLEANGVIYALGEQYFFDDTDAALIACEHALLKRFGIDSLGRISGRIANQALLKGLTREQLKALALHTQRHRFHPGDSVFNQGEQGNRAYFIVTGRADVLIDITGTDRKKRVSALMSGEVFGEVGVLDGAPRSATVTMTHSSTCLSIDAAKFHTLQTQHPDIVAVLLLNLSRTFANRLRLANIMISELEQ